MGITMATLLPVFTNITGGLFLAVCGSRNYMNRWFLALFMFNSALLFTGHFFYFNHFTSIYRYYDFIFLLALLSFFPLYYIYVKSVFDIRIRLKDYWLHFLPAILISVSAFTLSLAADDAAANEYFFRMTGKISLSGHLSGNLFFVYQSVRVIHILQIAIYSIMLIRYILMNLQQLKDYFSNMEPIRPLYFTAVNGIFLLFMIITGLATTLSGRGFFFDNEPLLLFSGLLFAIMHLTVSLHGIKQIPVHVKVTQEELDRSEKVTGTGSFEEIEQRLLSYFESGRPWLDPNLKIWDVVLVIGTNRTYLSRVINEKIHSNFSDFVNNYRVKEAQAIMKENTSSTFSLQAIAEMSGFGSCASFVRAFKKSTGQNPSDYRKQIK